MFIVGLSGGSGSGKSTVGKILSDFGFLTVDADRVYHSLVCSSSPCLDELVMTFGERILSPDGGLDRAILGDIVFSDTSGDMLKLLNSITHKHVLARIFQIIEENEGAGFLGAVIDAPLLFESGLDKRCNLLVCAVCDREVRLDRIMRRDGISRQKAERRISSQIQDSELVSMSQYSVDTNCSLSELEARVLDLKNKIMKIIN